MKKLFSCIIIVLLFLLSGCSATLRQVKNTQIERASQELDVTMISTAELQEQGIIFKESGIIVNIKNISKNMISINLNNSSMNLSSVQGDYTSRIISGNDRMKNINSMVPNIVIPPQGMVRLRLYPADLLEPNYSYNNIVGFSVNPPFVLVNKIRLSLAYHTEEENELNLSKTKFFIASYSI